MNWLGTADKLLQWVQTDGVNFKNKKDPPLQLMLFPILKMYYLWNNYFFNLVCIQKGCCTGQVPLSPNCNSDYGCFVAVHLEVGWALGTKKNDNSTTLFAERLQPMPIIFPHQPASLENMRSQRTMIWTMTKITQDEW
jgi:hypothetical protein